MSESAEVGSSAWPGRGREATEIEADARGPAAGFTSRATSAPGPGRAAQTAGTARDGGALAGNAHESAPLAVRMRPRTLDELVGQRQLLAAGLAAAPAGRGRPADVAAPVGSAGHRQDHDRRDPQPPDRPALRRGVRGRGRRQGGPSRDRRRRNRLATQGRETVLFVDEVHRFTKAQQDALLPGVENRWVTLVAATTENPFFSVISPLLSRSLLLTLEPLTDDDVRGVLEPARRRRARARRARSRSSDDAMDHLVRLAGGDARRGADLPRGRRRRRGCHRRQTDGRPRGRPRRPWTGPRCATTARATSTTT